MMRILRLAFPVFALLAGLMFIPSTGVARTAQPGWDDHRQHRVAPSARQRVAPRRKALRNPALRGERRAARSQAYRIDHRGRAIPVATPRHKAAARARVQRKRIAARQMQHRMVQPGLRPYAPHQAQRKPLPRMASLGNARLSRFVAPSSGRVEAQVDIRSQRMIVRVDGEVRHVWRVSTGKQGFATPRGVYGPTRMHVTYFSRKYYNSPMPYSIFFRGGYAVHGTNDVKRLGGPASHGCVRLAVPHARALFQMMKAYGPGRSRIVIS